MKLSNKPRHYAPRKKSAAAMNKNHPSGRISSGFTRTKSPSIAQLLFASMTNKVRRVFIQQQKALKLNKELRNV